jgi:hypothetical protein
MTFVCQFCLTVPAALETCLTFPPFCPDILFCVGYYNIKFPGTTNAAASKVAFQPTISAKILAHLFWPILVSNCQIELPN